MLSVLIPTYNYNVFPLVSELQKQCLECKIEFEILCQDDSSNTFELENLKVNHLENCNFSKNDSNLGRGININFLSEKSKFNWLLIMDCDTFPTQKTFIQNYIKQIKVGEKIVFGGIKYQKEKPDNNQLLRWIYGKNRESLSVEKRIKNPNGNALTSNLLIQKEIFLSTKFDESITKYGYEDLVFLMSLKKKGLVVKHIDNPTFHLGLETSQQFLDKTKTALENLKLISKTIPLDQSESKILRTYNFLKRFYLVSIISFLFKKGERKTMTNLLSQTPSLLLFDFYKLGYYCTI
ncbi:MAG: glycosyltransferase [Flavobacterium sp.]|uniref:glycosyltransferase family 2 protein n=1 Tax=Flavobacterium sp. TaxID=239 RepID=UPI0026237BF9|nr:glycosyltransferase [Flavobacterium sp.]MDD5150780.1 glycosyltransferase [Flavobacterium sp.]